MLDILHIFVEKTKQEEIKVKIKYYNGINERIEEVNNLYKDVAFLLAAEPILHPIEIKITNCLNPDEILEYRISTRSGTRFIVELNNTMPDYYLPEQIESVFLTCVDPATNAYKFYKLEQLGDCIQASYGRMGVKKRGAVRRKKISLSTFNVLD